jgi:hypothetical protein
MQSPLSTHFVDLQGRELADSPGILPIPLYKGMQITIHGHPKPFTVLDWSYHHGQPDETPGLKVILGE